MSESFLDFRVGSRRFLEFFELTNISPTTMSMAKRVVTATATVTAAMSLSQVPHVATIQHDLKHQSSANSSRIAYDPRDTHIVVNRNGQPVSDISDEYTDRMTDNTAAVRTLDDSDSDTENSTRSDLSSIIDTDHPGFQWVMSLSEFMPDYTVPCAPRSAEIVAAAQFVEGTPIGNKLMNEVPTELKGNFMEQVVEKAQDPSFRYLVHKAIESKRQAKLQVKAGSVKGDEEIDGEILVAWEQMAEKQRCVICQDLLCAPMVLKCSHSYCFHCLQEFTNQCQPADGNAEVVVVHTCPLCPYEFKMEDAIFVRTMHDNITEEVMHFPAAVKKGWEERLATYLIHEKKRQAEEKKKRDAEQFQRSQSELLEENRRSSSEWESFCTACVPIFAFIIIVMLGFTKR